jgi:hypothetical protein
MSAPGSPKLECKRVAQQRRQYQIHHSGSSSECRDAPNDNLCKELPADDEHDRLVRANSVTQVAGGSGGHGRKSSGQQQSSNGGGHACAGQPQECSTGSAAAPSFSGQAHLNHVFASAPALASVVVAPILVEESDSDLGTNQPSTSNSRSRQKKFLKTFKHLPQEEVVLQRYSCALVSDILLQVFFGGVTDPLCLSSSWALFFQIFFFLSTTLLTRMTNISIHMQWPLTSQLLGAENNWFYVTG